MRWIRWAAVALMVAWGALGTRGQVNTEQVMRIGQNALYFEDYMLSIQYFNQVISAKPYLAQPYFFRAIAKLNLDDYQGAEADASLAIDRNPFIVDAWEVRGVARQNQGKFQGAVDDYTHALTLLPHNKNIMSNRAMAQLALGDTIGATASYSDLIAAHPGYDEAYVGRSRLYMARGDTLAAANDADHAISINPDNPYAYIILAQITLAKGDSLERALDYNNKALKLLPRHTGLYVNRAYIRYKLDDYYGAMADFDYAIELDPLNPVAYFNRGLLRAELKDNDKALRDFSQVLKLRPDDQHALFNRMLLYRETGQYRKALTDIDRLLVTQTEMPGLLCLRSELLYKLGDKRQAARDNDRAMAMARAMKEIPEGIKDTEVEQSMVDQTSARFSNLLTLNNTDEAGRQEFNNPNIRGKVQDRDMTIEIEPMYALSYYSSPTELRPNPYYLKDIDDVNALGLLPNALMLINDDISLPTQADIDRQFAAIDTFKGKIGEGSPRAIDYFGKGMSEYTVRDYPGAVADFTAALELTPDFTLAWLQRGVARYRGANYKAPDAADDAELWARERQRQIAEAIADFDHVTKLAPTFAFAYFNKGVALADTQDFTSALAAFTQAIDAKPNFGEAYYNRGYVYLKLGNREAGMADLSKAGELGVIPSYNLLKRMRD